MDTTVEQLLPEIAAVPAANPDKNIEQLLSENTVLDVKNISAKPISQEVKKRLLKPLLKNLLPGRM